MVQGGGSDPAMEGTDHSATPWLHLLGPDGLRGNAPWICSQISLASSSQIIHLNVQGETGSLNALAVLSAM